jgi:YidC/Oxa1 family membrane protein insertase
MKLLRPELDTLRKKFGTDQQGFAMEQMKLFREAGCKSLGRMLSHCCCKYQSFLLYIVFFNSNISLRGPALSLVKRFINV